MSVMFSECSQFVPLAAQLVTGGELAADVAERESVLPMRPS